MWKAYMRMDGWVISSIQETYLWLLDRTGVYVATCSFALYVLAAVLDIAKGGMPIWTWMVLIAGTGFFSSHRYIMQDTGRNEAINAVALRMEGLQMRHFFNALLCGFVLGSIVILSPLSTVIYICFILFNYTFLIKIRDRDKKPFFEHALKLAMERRL